MPTEYDELETIELTEEDQAKIEAAHKEAENAQLIIKPTTITNTPKMVDWGLHNKPTPVYSIPLNTLIRLGNGSIMTYGQLEEMRHDYESVLARISQSLDDLSGYPI